MLYRYPQGYLLFELDEYNISTTVWRDLHHGYFPLATTFKMTLYKSLKIQVCCMSIVKKF